MQALVLRQGCGRLEERPHPRARHDEVVVRTTMASLCSADVSCVRGDFHTHEGCVLGHEAVGVVHEIGDLVDGFALGQRVAVASTTPCGQCANCQRGYSGHCRGGVWGGYRFGVSLDGSLAEYFAVPFAQHNLAPIPDLVSDAQALCVTDTIASGSTGPEVAQFPLGATVVVIGQGHIGLGATMAARALGAGLVVTVKARPGGEDLARAAGADLTLNLTEHDVVKEIRRVTGGDGADCVVEASGSIDSFPTAVAATRIGGTVAVLSSYNGVEGAQLGIPLAEWGWGIGDKTILSTFQRSGSERMVRLMRSIAAGRFDPSFLLTKRYTFGEVEQALADVTAREQGLIKPCITF